MLRFLIRRVLLGLFVMWIVTMIVFGLFFVNPAGKAAVARKIAGKQATVQTLALVTQRLDLDKPIYKQYWYFLFGHPGPQDPSVPKAQGLSPIGGTPFRLHTPDLGYDFYNGTSVNKQIEEAFPITLSLALGASILWLGLGLATGVLSAVRPRSLLDRSFTAMALFFYSMPSFVLGLLLLLFLYFRLTKAGFAWFPASNYVGITDDPVEWAHHLLLPWVTLAMVIAAAYTRLSRGSMLDVLGEDYIRTARAKGLSERRVVFKHGLRAALTPVVTQFGIDLGALLGGAIITEQVFSLPGLGYTAVNAITFQDLPVIIGITVLASAAIITANIVVDMLYAVLDPRVRLH